MSFTASEASLASPRRASRSRCACTTLTRATPGRGERVSKANGGAARRRVLPHATDGGAERRRAGRDGDARRRASRRAPILPSNTTTSP
eukprot:6197744-Pleurochrysis_carterae.AAC.2